MTPKRPARKSAPPKRPAAVTPQVNRQSSVVTGPKPEDPNGTTESDGQDATQDIADQLEETPEYEPTHPRLEAAGLDQHAAEEKRQAELARERDEHNRRTGDASLNKGTWT